MLKIPPIFWITLVVVNGMITAVGGILNERTLMITGALTMIVCAINYHIAVWAKNRDE